MGKKKAQLPPISIFVGRCDRRKYETTARVLGKLVSEKYSSDVQYVHRIKRLPRNIEIASFTCLSISCLIFLVLMFNRPILDLVWFYDFTWLEEKIADTVMVWYVIAVLFFVVSYIVKFSSTFEIFIDGKCVYEKQRGKQLPSVDDLMAIINYSIKSKHSNYQDYLK